MDTELPREKPIFRDALSRLDLASSHLETSSEIFERLKHPKRTIMVSIPVRMDDGSLQVFRGHRIQFDDSRGLWDAIAPKGTYEFFKQTGL